MSQGTAYILPCGIGDFGNLVSRKILDKGGQVFGNVEQAADVDEVLHLGAVDRDDVGCAAAGCQGHCQFLVGVLPGHRRPIEFDVGILFVERGGGIAQEGIVRPTPDIQLAGDFGSRLRLGGFCGGRSFGRLGWQAGVQAASTPSRGSCNAQAGSFKKSRLTNWFYSWLSKLLQL